MNFAFGSNSDYYTWHHVDVRTRRHTFELYDKPGIARFGQPDHAATLLADEMEIEPGETVLVFNCGAGLPGLAAAEAGAHVAMADSNVVAVEAAQRTAEANGLADRITVTASGSPPSPARLEGTSGQHGDAGQVARPALQSQACPKVGGRGTEHTGSPPPPPTLGGTQGQHGNAWQSPQDAHQATPKIGAEYDVVALLLPKGKAMAQQSIWDAYGALKPGGRFYIAGANAEGAKSYFRYAEELFGSIAVHGYRKGCRVGVARKPTTEQPVPPRFQEPWLDHDHCRQFDVMFEDRTLHVCSRPGVFSWDRLDAGTQALLGVLEISAADSVLDLGCGCGVIGTAAAMTAPQGQVLMLDANINAVVSARQTLAANGINNAAVELSDCASVVQDRTFDVVVTNPPFHQGKATQYDVAYQFIRDAARLLRSDGRFYLVANRFIPYEDAIRRWLGEADTIYEDKRFKVLLGCR